ncbi:acyl-CoA carboxylase subunit epsilon [Rhodococcus aerolatus]
MTGTETGTAPVRPLLRVVRGNPDDHELAALTAVVAALASGGGGEAPAAPPEAWGRPDSLVRGRFVDRPGPGAWLRSGLPV